MLFLFAIPALVMAVTETPLLEGSVTEVTTYSLINERCFGYRDAMHPFVGHIDLELTYTGEGSPPTGMQLLIFESGGTTGDADFELSDSHSCLEKEVRGEELSGAKHAHIENITFKGPNIPWAMKSTPIGGNNAIRTIYTALLGCQGFNDVKFSFVYHDTGLFKMGTGPSTCVKHPGFERESYSGEIAGLAIGIIIFLLAIAGLCVLLWRECGKRGQANHARLPVRDENDCENVQMHGQGQQYSDANLDDGADAEC